MNLTAALIIFCIFDTILVAFVIAWVFKQRQNKPAPPEGGNPNAKGS